MVVLYPYCCDDGKVSGGGAALEFGLKSAIGQLRRPYGRPLTNIRLTLLMTDTMTDPMTDHNCDVRAISHSCNVYV